MFFSHGGASAPLVFLLNVTLRIFKKVFNSNVLLMSAHIKKLLTKSKSQN
jgi:hypothetical protein